MHWYFGVPQRVAMLEAALERWEGTPFGQGCAECQVAVDCVGLVREVLREAGLDVGPVENIPQYALFHGVHHKHSPLLAWLHEDNAARKALDRVDRDAAALPGDIYAMRVSAGVHHLCILDAQSRLWHVPIYGAVAHFELTEAVRKKSVVILRLRDF